ncbi:hypothetical protein QMK50_23930 [Pseudomonas sp. P5_152]|uniref:hypothetical protein n=1 Tax=Pseudomonas sp. P5_152 TaxID=3043442 RepID=UPI002A36650C|nr:hypothetical protein [Pseudomonas sp. P5_152]MDX9668003.1 hypothetical protein [Pseudomonas sp. P5_152]
MSLNSLRALRALVLLSIFCVGTANAAGLIKLSHTELYIEPGRPTSDLIVENIGDTPLFLNIEQSLLSNPGDVKEILTPIEKVEKPSLLVVPNRLILGPSQKYKMHLKILDQNDKNQIWRVTFRPRERISLAAEANKTRSPPLLVKIGYGVVIYQKPKHN